MTHYWGQHPGDEFHGARVGSGVVEVPLQGVAKTLGRGTCGLVKLVYQLL
jgi:hypothetical protein